MKTLLAQNTLVTLHTQEDDDIEYHTEKPSVTEHSPIGRQNYHSRNHLDKSNTSLAVGPKRSKSPVPGLDFSNLKHVKDYKDWYAYAKKLEDAVTLLNQRIKLLEDENQELKDAVSSLQTRMDALTTENKQLLSNNSDQKSLTSAGDGKKHKRTKSVVNFAKRTDLSL